MAYIDPVNFSGEQVSKPDGRKIIRSRREKTDESFVTLFLPEAEKTAEKYDCNLPEISNRKYSDYLKLSGAGVGTGKNITSHATRHTFATYLINRDIPVESVSGALGHASIKQTQHYARLPGKKVVNDMSKFLVNPPDKTHLPPGDRSLPA
jgi:integrase